MEPSVAEALQKLSAQVQALTFEVDRLSKILESSRRWTKIGWIVTLVMIIGPLLILPFILPSFLGSLGVATGGASADSQAQAALIQNLLGN